MVHFPFYTIILYDINAMQVVTREYTINMHKRLHGIGFKYKAPRAVKVGPWILILYLDIDLLQLFRRSRSLLRSRWEPRM